MGERREAKGERSAPLLTAINPVFVLSSRPWARASLSFKFKIKSDAGLSFPISSFPIFLFSFPTARSQRG